MARSAGGTGWRCSAAGAVILASLIGAATRAGATIAVGADSASATVVPDSVSDRWRAARSRPAFVQVSAPSINSASPELLDRAFSPRQAGVALDHRFQRGADLQALTFNMTPLAILHLVGHGQSMSGPSDSWSERAVARITVGGPPQFIDSLRTAHAGRATNHVTSELKLRLRDGAGTDPRGSAPVSVALALTADNLGTGYGLDRYGGTLIAERDTPCAWTANAGYRVVERYRTLERLAESKLGLGAQWRWPRLRALDFGISGACLLRNHGRTPVWQGAASADLDVDGLHLSLATRRSDRPEVRGDERGRSVLSVAYDLAGR